MGESIKNFLLNWAASVEMEFLPVAPASPTRRRSRNESFPIRNERALIRLSHVVPTRGGSIARVPMFTSFSRRSLSSFLSRAFFHSVREPSSYSLCFLASDSLVRFLRALLLLSFYYHISISMKTYRKCADVSIIRL